MSGNDRELIVLAGAELVDVIERGSRNIADLAALFLVCGGVQNARTATAVPEIPEIAAKYLSRRSVGRANAEKDGKEETLSNALSAGDPSASWPLNFKNYSWNFLSFQKSPTCCGG